MLTATFRLLFGLLMLRYDRRKLIHITVTEHPTADWMTRQVSEAFLWDTAPKYLMRDRDHVYGVIFRRRLGAMGIMDRPTTQRSPWQNGCVERLIGSIRKECMEHAIVLSAAHLRRILAAYAEYYNRTRTHLSLNKDIPLPQRILREGQFKLVPHLGCLHHSLVRI